MWREALADLNAQVRAWSEEMGYAFVGHDPVPGEALAEITHGANRFYLEPAEFAEENLPATVWLYSYPTMRRVRLFGPADGNWEIQSSDGVPFHRILSKAEFTQLLTDLNADVA